MALDVSKFIHPLDAKAMAAMKAIPGFDLVSNAFLKFYDENLLHVENMATRVRIGPRQLPQFHRLLQEVCEALEMDEPELYLENGRSDAMSLGDKRPFIVLQSGLLSCLTMPEIKSVLGCMCGHILCGHNRYETMATMMVDAGSGIFGLASAITKPVYWALMAWLRCSGFTADRIDAYVSGSPDVTISKLMKIKGGVIYNHENVDLNQDAYLRQAQEYQEELTLSKVQQWTQKWLSRDKYNPFPVIRCIELRKWWDEGGCDLADDSPQARKDRQW